MYHLVGGSSVFTGLFWTAGVGQSFWTVLLLGLLACVLSNKYTYILVQLFLEVCVFHLVMGLVVCFLAGGSS